MQTTHWLVVTGISPGALRGAQRYISSLGVIRSMYLGNMSRSLILIT